MTRAQFHLLVEGKLDSTPGLPGSEPTLQAVEIPAGFSFLERRIRGDRGVHLRSLGGPAGPPGDFGPGAIGVEVVTLHKRPTLVLFTGPESDALVNGARAPRLTPLRVGDQLQFRLPSRRQSRTRRSCGPRTTAHVTTYQTPAVGPPAPDRLGTACPVCRIPLAADARVLTCANCATPLHLEGEEKPETERLSCALLSPTCPHCEHELVMHEGYLWLPEGLTLARGPAAASQDIPSTRSIAEAPR